MEGASDDESTDDPLGPGRLTPETLLEQLKRQDQPRDEILGRDGSRLVDRAINLYVSFWEDAVGGAGSIHDLGSSAAAPLFDGLAQVEDGADDEDLEDEEEEDEDEEEEEGSGVQSEVGRSPRPVTGGKNRRKVIQDEDEDEECAATPQKKQRTGSIATQGSHVSAGSTSSTPLASQSLTPRSGAPAASHVSSPLLLARSEGGGDEGDEGDEGEEGEEGGEGGSGGFPRPPQTAVGDEGIVERLGRLLGCIASPQSPQPPKSVDNAVLQHIVLVAEIGKLCSHTADLDEGGSESMLSKNTESGMKRRGVLTRVSMMIAFARRMLASNAVLVACLDEGSYQTLSWEESLLVNLNDESAKGHQIVLFHLLDILSSPVDGGPFRRMGDMIFKEILTPEGHRTNAWCEHDTIIDFIHKTVNPTSQYQLWSVMTTSDFNMPARLRDYLIEGNNGSFPLLQWNRYLFSFRNGIFCSIQLAFYPYDRRDLWPRIAKRADKRIRAAFALMTARMKNAFSAIMPFAPPSRLDASAKYFDMIFDEQNVFPDTPLMDIDAAQIRCEDLLYIFRTQRFTDDTIRDKLWSMGKMLFPVGLMEDTQVFSFDYGKGGTGKSTALNALKSLFHPRRVCVLQSDCEETFGLQPMLTGGTRMNAAGDCTVPDTVDAIFAPEVKEDFRLSSAKVQQFTSGDAVSIARKGLGAINIDPWTAPIALAGNVIPRKSNWRDLSGAVLRRCNLYAHNVTVKETDSDLPMKIEASTPEYLPRIVITFIQFSITIGSRSVWREGVFGEQTRKFRDIVATSTQPMRNFLQNSGKVKLAGPGLDGKPKKSAYIEEDKFRSLLSEWTRSIGIANVPYTSENYEAVFEDLAIERAFSVQQVGGDVVTGYFLFGVEEYDEAAAQADLEDAGARAAGGGGAGGGGDDSDSDEEEAEEEEDEDGDEVIEEEDDEDEDDEEEEGAGAAFIDDAASDGERGKKRKGEAGTSGTKKKRR